MDATVEEMERESQAWELCKQLAGFIKLPESCDLQGEEREVYNTMAAQDFYNLLHAYNKRYVDRAWSEEFSKILDALEKY